MKQSKAIALILIIILMLSICGCSKPTEQKLSVTYVCVTGGLGDDGMVIFENLGEGGSISGNNLQAVPKGIATSVVTAVPNMGFGFLCWSDGVTDFTRQDIVTENTVVYAVFEQLYSTAPVINILTQSSQQITSNEEYLQSKVTLENCDAEFAFSDAVAGIRLRGNSTMYYLKKPFRLKFQEPLQLLGLGKGASKSWVLLAEYSDTSYMRNYLTYTLAGRLEHIGFCTDFAFVEVYLNHEYIGVYLLAEQIEVSDVRLDIDDSGIKNGACTDTGYLLELEAGADRRQDEGIEGKDWFAVDGYALPVLIPSTGHSDGCDVAYYVIKSDAKSAAQVQYIKNYMETVYDAIYQKQGSVTVGTKKYECGTYAAVNALVDIDSALDMYILQLLCNDYDNNFSSAYVYKDAGGKLCFGVPWDFDLSWGNYVFHSDTNTVYLFHLLRALEKFDWFREAAQQRFEQLMGKDNQYLLEFMLQINAINQENQEIFSRDVYLYGTHTRLTLGQGYVSQDVAYQWLYRWILQRVDFMYEYLYD